LNLSSDKNLFYKKVFFSTFMFFLYRGGVKTRAKPRNGAPSKGRSFENGINSIETSGHSE